MLVTICIGSSCHLKGSRDIISILERLIYLQPQSSFLMNRFSGGFDRGSDRV